jgi:diguanylate cyclase (GGDEF)-like protein
VLVLEKIKKFFKIFLFIKKIGIEKTLERIESFPYDALTGLYNRRVLEEEKKGEYTVVFVDLDDFKKINDFLGYKKGDEILEKFASVLKSFSRKEDLFVRWGGDEFILFLPETKRDGAEKLMKRIKTEVENLPFELRFSFGIIESKNEGFSSIIREASYAMQKHKEQNKRAIL